MPQLFAWLVVGLFALQLLSGGRSRRRRKLEYGMLRGAAEPGFGEALKVFEAPIEPELARKNLLTEPELRFWAVLRAALPDHLIAPQVAMGALLKPRADAYSSGFLSTRAQFAQKIVDFAVIEPASGEVLAIVELDDADHDDAGYDDSGYDDSGYDENGYYDAGHDDELNAARDAMLAQGDYRVIRFANGPLPTHDDVRGRMGWLLEPASEVARP